MALIELPIFPLLILTGTGLLIWKLGISALVGFGVSAFVGIPIMTESCGVGPGHSIAPSKCVPDGIW